MMCSGKACSTSGDCDCFHNTPDGVLIRHGTAIDSNEIQGFAFSFDRVVFNNK